MRSLLQRVAQQVGFVRFVRLLRFWPPFVGAGVRVTGGATDASRVSVELPLTHLNRNLVGTQFGGSLYAMCDPFFMLMLMQRLGPEYVVWDKAAWIEFLSPGRGTVRATFEVPDARVEEIRREVARSGRALPEFDVTVLADGGTAVARVHKVLHVRERARPAPGAAAPTVHEETAGPRAPSRREPAAPSSPTLAPRRGAPGAPTGTGNPGRP